MYIQGKSDVAFVIMLADIIKVHRIKDDIDSRNIKSWFHCIS